MTLNFFWQTTLCDWMPPTLHFDMFVDLFFLLGIVLTFVTGVMIAGEYEDDMCKVCGNVWSRATRHSLEEWMGSDAMDAVLSRPTEQALKERVGGNATDLDGRLELGCTGMSCHAPLVTLSRNG